MAAVKFYIIFCVLSVFLILISRRSLLHPYSHGFYRFLGWECLLWLIINNILFWFDEPLAISQIISWIFLMYSLVLLIPGITMMSKSGKAGESREDSTLYGFEKTTELVETGIFKYVRHPLYGSLLFLTWGVCLKNPELIVLIISILASIFFYTTAVIEEKEDIEYFGDKYKVYIKRSKMFIPLIF